MELLVDCGNTRLKWRLQEQDTVTLSGALLVSELCVAQLQASLPKSANVLYWASVASTQKNQCLLAWAQQNTIACHQITAKLRWQDLTNGYQDPQQLGVDRWLAMVAARQHTQKAVCVVDCGSAITFDYVSAKGQHEGSYIMPGARLMAQALVRDTAQIKLTHQAPVEAHPGTTTSQSMLAGCQHMAHHGVRALVKEAQADGYQILLCGGDGLALADSLGVPYIAELVLDGLAQLASLDKH